MESTPKARQTIKTYCLMCSVRCPVICEVANGKLVKVSPDLQHPLGGTFCVKGASAPEFVYDPTRLKYPMKRTNPKSAHDPGWVRISWEEAMDTIAQKLLQIRDKYGPEAVAFYRPAMGGSPSYDYQPWLLRLTNVWGTPNYVKTTHICNWHKDNGSRYTYGVGIPEADYENSGCILVWGTNPHATALREAVSIDRAVKKGAKVIVIDPKKIPLTQKSALQLYVRPGTDLALALGLINQVIERRLYDKEFVSRWTNAPFLVRSDNGKLLTEEALQNGGSSNRYVVWDTARNKAALYDAGKVSYESETVQPLLDGEAEVKLKDGKTLTCSTVLAKLKEAASDFTPEKTEQITAVPAETIVKTVELIASSRPLSYYTYNGLEQHTDAMQINRAVCILYSLFGDFDRKGGNVLYPDMPLNSVAGFNLMPLDVQKKRLGSSKHPLGPAGVAIRDGAVQAYELYESILTGKPYQMHALMSFGGNLIISNGDTLRGMEALRNLDFYVHVDFYENPTSRFADILLPAASSWEAECVGKYEFRDKGHVQLRRKVVDPQYERRGDLDIIFELAVRLGLGEQFFGGDMWAGYNHMLKPLGKTVGDVRAEPDGILVPLVFTPEKHKQIDHETDKIVGFDTPTRLIEIYSKTFADHGYEPIPGYQQPLDHRVDRDRFPLLLVAYKPIQFIHGSYRSIPSLRKRLPEPMLQIHPQTAEKLAVNDGDWVAVETPRGSVRAKAEIYDGLLPEVVAGQEGWWQGCDALGLPAYDPFSEKGANFNLVIGNDLVDPISGSVPHRGIPCSVRKV
ncbi:MAG: molybdopterin-dependent oxidoreductase [Thaumarchaeota archaeon]|nr:molybdopterin-dependent oxidoreductase [Nitrososphaerota archaeon]